MTKFPDYETAEATVERAWDKIERMQPVYDAAMAWSKARKDYDNGPTSLLGVGLELAEDRLLDACSQVEEVEHGQVGR